MECASLYNLQEELITKIIVSTLQYDEDAGLPEFLILASIYRRVRRIHASTASHVIWDVGARSMAALEDVIVALSPSEDVEQRSLTYAPQGLCHGTEEMFIQWNLDTPARELRYVGAQGDWAKTRAAWTERFHRSAYRIFVPGSMLSRAYHEPFFREDSSAKDGYFVVYDLEDFEIGNLHGQTAVFGAFAERVPSTTPLLQEYGTSRSSLHVTSNIVSAPGHYCHDHQSQMYLRFAKKPTATRTATIVMCGSFSPKDITMPDCIADAKDSVLCARMIDRRGEQDPSLLLDLVFEPFFATSPGHGRRAGHPSPPPPLQL
ncbi:hypothetical protein CGCF415_v015128 [Colletotrichum fructicola]|nr:hypothetical protein CGCF415_v015128 [Colletotrichum fructicola]KAF4923317.1 hypothetical protein CGCF245_v015003 [Colletotrichum fructicola]